MQQKGFILIEFIFALVILGIALKLYFAYSKEFSISAKELRLITEIGNSQEMLFKQTQSRELTVTTANNKRCEVKIYQTPKPSLMRYELKSCT